MSFMGQIVNIRHYLQAKSIRPQCKLSPVNKTDHEATEADSWRLFQTHHPPMSHKN